MTLVAFAVERDVATAHRTTFTPERLRLMIDGMQEAIVKP